MSVTDAPRVTTPPFVPLRWLENGHVMTVFAWARGRQFPSLPAPEARLIRVSPDTQVLAQCYWQAERSRRPTLMALHGLEGSSEAHYMRGLADKAWRRGWNAVLLNQRNCGGTEPLTPGLYHSGLTEDPRLVIRALADDEGLRSFGVVGYSLGGNVTMKLAGELADHPDLPVRAVVAVSPTIDLERCVRAIERRVNIAYEWNFVRHLKARMRARPSSGRGVRSHQARRHPYDSRVRRDLHGAAPRLRRRDRLLPSCERHPRDRSHPDPGADSHGRGRSVRAGGAVRGPGCRGECVDRAPGRTRRRPLRLLCAPNRDDGYWRKRGRWSFASALT